MSANVASAKRKSGTRF